MIVLGTLGKDSSAILQLIEVLARYQEPIAIDAAPRYGNLADVGEALRRSGMPRNAFVVTTKINRERQEQLGAIRSLQSDLTQLGLDYVDHYLIHSPSYSAYGETWAEMQEAVALGLTRQVGVSAFSYEQVTSLPLAQPSVVQVPPLEEYANPDILAEYRRRGIAIEGYSFVRKATKDGEAAATIEVIARGVGVDSMTLLASWCAQVDLALILGTSQPDRLERFAQLQTQHLDEKTLAAVGRAVLKCE